MPSPACTVNSTATTNGVDVTASSTPTIALVSASGVTVWELECIGTDENNVAATINASLSINQVAKTATFSAPSSLGSALIFRSRVNNGVDANGTVQSSYTTTFKVSVLTSGGARVGALNETTENSATFGWVGVVNGAVRLSPSGAGTITGAPLTWSGSAWAQGTYISLISGTNISQSGAIRLPKDQTIIAVRRADNLADLPILVSDGSDNITIGSGTSCAGIYLSALYSLVSMISGAIKGRWESSGLTIGGSAGSFGGGAGCISLLNAGTNPSTNPTGGCVIYADSGAGKVRGSSGTVTTFGAAEPHCPRCGRDFALEWENKSYGGTLSICVPCLLGELSRVGVSLSDVVIKNEVV